MAGAWVSSYSLNVEGFLRILHTTLQKLGVKDHPEYEGREYEMHGTDRWEVTVYIGKSEEFPNITEAWNVTATGFRFVDTYQVVAHKALRYLCQIFEEPIAHTPCGSFLLWTRIGGHGGPAWRLCKDEMCKRTVPPWCT